MAYIECTDRTQVLVDEALVQILDFFTWTHLKLPNWDYATTQIGGKTRYMHRMIMGVTDRNIFVDHRDRNGLNNQGENLRLVTNQQNQWNSIRSPISEVGERGIDFHKGQFRVRMRIGGGNRREKSFRQLDDAVAWRDEQYAERRELPN